MTYLSLTPGSGEQNPCSGGAVVWSMLREQYRVGWRRVLVVVVLRLLSCLA